MDQSSPTRGYEDKNSSIMNSPLTRTISDIKIMRKMSRNNVVDQTPLILKENKKQWSREYEN